MEDFVHYVILPILFVFGLALMAVAIVNLIPSDKPAKKKAVEQ